MAGFSSVTVLGNITRDPELRYTSSGTAVCDVCLAINQGRGDKQVTVFIDVTFWGGAAETISEYCRKGRPLLVGGELAQDEWTDKESGQPRKKIKITSRSFCFLPKNTESGEAGGRAPSRKAASAKPKDDLDVGHNDPVPF